MTKLWMFMKDFRNIKMIYIYHLVEMNDKITPLKKTYITSTLYNSFAMFTRVSNQLKN